MTAESIDIIFLLGALHFASDKHKGQRRKGRDASPYINHPIAVAELLARVGGITDSATLAAAILHDTVEDTQTTFEEIEAQFGADVRGLVEEMTDDKSLPKQTRKDLQIRNAAHKSVRAKQIKLADKICNVRDMICGPPTDWSDQRKVEYITWAESVVAGLRGTNAALEACFDAAMAESRQALTGSRP